MPKLKPGTETPTPQEEARIRAGIDADPDAFELDARWFDGARPVRETHPHIVERQRRRQDQSEVREPPNAKLSRTNTKARRQWASPSP